MSRCCECETHAAAARSREAARQTTGAAEGNACEENVRGSRRQEEDRGRRRGRKKEEGENKKEGRKRKGAPNC